MQVTRTSFFAGLLLCLPMVLHAEMTAFVSGSMEQITTSRKGEPFLLVLWSIDCPPCMKELHQLGEMRSRFSQRNLVLVSTDDQMNPDSVWKIIADNHLDQFENRIFSDDFTERLRYQIDPDWFGELPRAYFYSADHRRLAQSGVLSEAVLERWFKASKKK
ncbi:MAG: redoxin domain-containing protein [Sedimenticola sp.]|nr:redoxin domain-containing protein [Sedimenticola sp.]